MLSESDLEERKHRHMRKKQALLHLLATREKFRQEQARKRHQQKGRTAKKGGTKMVTSQQKLHFEEESHLEVILDSDDFNSSRVLRSRSSSLSMDSNKEVSLEAANRHQAASSESHTTRPRVASSADRRRSNQQASENGNLGAPAAASEAGPLTPSHQSAKAEGQKRPSLTSNDGSLLDFLDREGWAFASIKEDEEANTLHENEADKRRHAGWRRGLPCSKGCCICSWPAAWDDWRAYYPIESLNVFAAAYNSLVPDEHGWRKLTQRHCVRMMHAALAYSSRALEEAVQASGLLARGSGNEVFVKNFWELLMVVHTTTTHMLEHQVEALLSSHDLDHLRKVFRGISNSTERLPTSQLFRAVRLVECSEVDISLVEHQRMVANATGAILEHKAHHKTEKLQEGSLTQADFLGIILQVLMVREQQRRREDLESEREAMAEGGFSQLELEDLRALHAEYTSMQVPDGLGALARLVRMLALCGGNSPSTSELSELRDIVHAGICHSWSAQRSAVAPFHVFALWMHKIFSAEICGLRRWGAAKETVHTGATGFVATVYNETHLEDQAKHAHGAEESEGESRASSRAGVMTPRASLTNDTASNAKPVRRRSRVGNVQHAGTPPSRAGTPSQRASTPLQQTRIDTQAANAQRAGSSSPLQRTLSGRVGSESPRRSPTPMQERFEATPPSVPPPKAGAAPHPSRTVLPPDPVTPTAQREALQSPRRPSRGGLVQ